MNNPELGNYDFDVNCFSYNELANAEKRGNIIIMHHETYNPEHDGSESRIFTAMASPYKYNGKNILAIAFMLMISTPAFGLSDSEYRRIGDRIRC